jgi:DNA polymerase-3 subunit gamma/tau
VKKVDEFGYSMRHFCQELINHFRNLAIAGLVENASDLLDLAEAEMSEIASQAGTVKQDEMQRHLSILLKAESEMAASGFPRLVLELALVRMCTMAPVVPITDLLERLKAAEGKGGGSSAPVASPRTNPSPVRSAEPPKSENSPATANIERGKPDAAQGDKSWPGFVAFVMGKRAGLGSILEHGHPLAISPQSMKIGFPGGSFYFSSIKDPETVAAVKGLAQHYFNTECSVEIVALEKEAKDIPLSEAQKKNLDATQRLAGIREKGAGHPMVAAALEILGGEISDISEAEE